MKTKTTKIFSFLGILVLGMMSFHLSAQSDTARDNRIYMFVPQMPSFPGNLDNYMGDHLQYPQSAIDKGIQGTVNVTFVITQTGEINDVTILSGVSPDLDSEAVRVVKTMPPWNPGMKNGKAVNVQYNLAIYFELNNIHNKQQPDQRREMPAYRPIDTTFTLRDGLYVDPYIGIGEGGPNSSTSIPINMGLNMKFGVGVSYMFPSNLGISLGLQLQQYNFNYITSNTLGTFAYNGTATAYRTTSNDTTVTAGYDATVTYSFTYAQVPVLCRYISSQENRLGFYAEAGLVISYLVNSQISGTATQTQYQLAQAANTYWYSYNTTYTNSTTLNLTSQNPAKLIVAVHAGAGILIPLTNKISIIADVAPDFGIMNTGQGNNDVVNFGSSKYYLFGKGNYGSFNAYLFDAKILIKMSGSSKSIRIN